jgi:hypothetical protein
MSNRPIRRTLLSGVVAAVVSLGLFVKTANSQLGRELNAGGNEQKLQARVALLETRLGELEERLRQVEQGDSVEGHSTNVKPQSNSVGNKLHSRCTIPSYLDGSGVRRVRRECLQGNSVGNCESPFVVDIDGIKRVKPDCL